MYMYLMATSLLLISTQANAGYVNGYYKSNGTYVQSHNRTNPNSNSYDNYSTKGNANPYTGQQGTASPCASNPNAYGCPPPSN